MPTYSDSLIKLIDERIRLLVGGGEGGDPDQGRQLPIAAPGVMGTVADRNSGALVFGISDTFTRTTSGELGLADTGQEYTLSGGSASDYSTTGTRAQLSLGSLSISRNAIIGSNLGDVNVMAPIVCPVLATGGNINIATVAHWVDGNNFYQVQAAHKTTGLVDLALIKRVASVDTTLVTATDAIGYTPGTPLSLRLRINGNNLDARIWSGSEPTTWMVSASASDHARGSVGMRGILSGTNSNTPPVNVAFESFAVASPLLDSWPDQHLITVLVDGGGGEVEALCFSNVRARPGDRVGLQKFGAYWIVTGTFGKPGSGATQHFPVYGWRSGQLTGTGSTTSASFAVVAGAPTASFVKEHDYTGVEVHLHAVLSCTVAAATEVRLGVRFTGVTGGAVTDAEVIGFVFDETGVNNQISGWRTIEADALPAGAYTVSLIWRRITGTGSPSYDGTDQTSLRIQESTVPYSVTA